MKTDKQLVEWFEKLHQEKAIYLWGANSEIITKSLTDKLFTWFGSKTYDKGYYDNKFKEGFAKIGADCSGSFKPISGFDTTAQGYYNSCKEKGLISKIPMNKVCLVFRKNLSGRITHIGLYCGNGYTIEMKSSKENCVKEKLKPWRWTYYGVPNWIEYPKGNPYQEPIGLIKKGSVGDGVKWVQWELIEFGLTSVWLNGKRYKIEVNGICDAATEKAIRWFQRKNGLDVDGVVGKDTRKKMKEK